MRSVMSTGHLHSELATWSGRFLRSLDPLVAAMGKTKHTTLAVQIIDNIKVSTKN